DEGMTLRSKVLLVSRAARVTNRNILHVIRCTLDVPLLQFLSYHSIDKENLPLFTDMCTEWVYDDEPSAQRSSYGQSHRLL
ncbi:hypothetical protein, partial [Haematospirillum sp. H4485]|uniref:hypothetical protein n=1 Tax=Haematospirillum sp. H4485 TaxID=2723109 RepID=UPI001ADE8A8F